jgi:hypothetical protein
VGSARNDAHSAVLKLIALDPVDLAVLSAHIERSSLTRSDLVYSQEERRFMLAVRLAKPPHALAGLRFDRVLRVERLNMPNQPADLPLCLIGAGFEPGIAPAGRIILLFEDARSIRLTVECVEAALGEFAEGPRKGP